MSVLEGYDIDMFDDPVDESLICPVCHSVMRDPQLVVDCGHHFCKACISALLRSDKPMCALDRQPLSTEPGRIVEDRSVGRKVHNLHVRCENGRQGCEWKGALRDLENHLKLRRCVVVCANGCTTRFPISEMERHVRFDCPLARIHCPFKAIGNGCFFECERQAMSYHLQTSILEHQLLVVVSLNTVLDTLWNVSCAPAVERCTTFGWSFKNFSQCIAEKTRVYSDPFYTGPCDTGYCLQIRVETGDNPEGVCVYYSLAKGKNDDRLEWPFRRNIRLSVIHSIENRCVVSALTTPPIEEEAIKAIIAKPTAKRNSRGRGKRNMLPFSRLEEAGVIAGDCLRVRAVVPWLVDEIPSDGSDGAS